MSSQHCNRDELMILAKQANAALAALGGFDDTIKPGSEAEVLLYIYSLTARFIQIS